jgi:hypothetical protein
MSLLETALAKLENRLQTLVEGTFSPRFATAPNGLPAWNTLARVTLQALHDHIQPEPDGTLLAPSQWTLLLAPSAAQTLQSHTSMLNSLTDLLHQSGVEAGVTFLGIPSITVSADPLVAPQEVRLQVEHSRTRGGDTAVLQSPSHNAEVGSGEAFLIINGSKTFPLVSSVVNIGRRSDNHLVLNDPRVSRNHAQLRLVRGRYVLFDLDSTGGTFLNGQRIAQSAALFPGDVISLAGVTIIFGQEASSVESTQAL